MRPSDISLGLAEVRAAGTESAALFGAVALFSAFVNLLMLTGPMFMLQVYDRVLGSRSQETLLALFGLVVFLFAVMGVLDLARTRVMARVGARVHERLEARVFAAGLERRLRLSGDSMAASSLRDLEAVHRFIASPVVIALLDFPWALIFLFILFVFHPWLGLCAVLGAGVLVVAALLNQTLSRAQMLAAHEAAVRAERLADQLRDEAEQVRAMGMQGNGLSRWQTARVNALRHGLAATDTGGGFAVFSRTFRLFLQSASLALGAWLVILGELTPGAMIAASILMGRALAPIEQVIAGWALVQRAHDGWRRLAVLLASVPQEPRRTQLPRPRALLEVSQLSLLPPGAVSPTLRMVSFSLMPGQALGVIGPSGSGKSTLARALCGALPIAAGHIRLDGASLEQFDPDQLGRLIGYLPQRVHVFDGTIAENIARLAQAPDAAAVVAAAQKAGAHHMILALPQGYDTALSAVDNGRLSGGQLQRIGLARALYGDPVLVVLDEPNANLDHEGARALNSVIQSLKQEQKAVLIMAHRPAALSECDLLLVLDGGVCRAFGARDQVLRKTVQNVGDISHIIGLGGAA